MKLKITITPDGGPEFTLGDDSAPRELSGRNWPTGAGGSVTDGFLGDQNRVIDSNRLFRGAYVLNIDRGQLNNSFPVRVKRTFDTETNMTWFRLTHADGVPLAGLLTVYITTSDGKVTGYLDDAKISKIRFQSHTGVTGVWTYDIVGNGPWLTTKPT